MTFGQKLRELRIMNNIKQYELAKILYCSKTSLSKMELDKTKPSNSILIDIANLFNVSIGYLLDNKMTYKEYKTLTSPMLMELLADTEAIDLLKNPEVVEAFQIFKSLDDVDKLAVIHLIEFKLYQSKNK